MEVRHELVIPNDDLPFRLFIFEGRDGNYKVTKHWHHSVEIFLVQEGRIDFYINNSTYPLKNRILCWSILMKSIPLNAQILISP